MENGLEVVWCCGRGEVIMAIVQVTVDSGLDQSHGIIDGGKGNTIWRQTDESCLWS